MKENLTEKVTNLEEELTKVQLVLLDFSKRLIETEAVLKEYQMYYPLPPSLRQSQSGEENSDSNAAPTVTAPVEPQAMPTYPMGYPYYPYPYYPSTVPPYTYGLPASTPHGSPAKPHQ